MINKDGKVSKTKLKNAILKSLKIQGIKPNCKDLSKEEYKKIQEYSTQQLQIKYKKTILKFLPTVKNYLINYKEIDPEKINLKLIEVKSNTIYEDLYKWWNLTWWSIPYQKAYGRQMRFLVWDEYHNAPFGLIGLQSPILKTAPRDNYLNLPKDELDLWANKSMNAQRIGALPPYNNLIGGKLVSLILISNEIRLAYEEKYKNRKTIIKNRELLPELHYITTTSAFGKSSIYNRLKIENHLVSKSIGFTKGYGSFHINDELFKYILQLLKEHNIPTNRSFGSGPSKRIKILYQAFNILGLAGLEKHGLQREFFIFENISNIHDVIHNNEKPIYYNYSIDMLSNFWKDRWAIKRYQYNKNNNIEVFDKNIFLDTLINSLN